MKKIKKLFRHFFAIKKEGLIYDISQSGLSGEVIVVVTYAAKVIYHTTKILASALIVTGAAGFFLTFLPLVSSEVVFRLGQISQVQKHEQARVEEIIVQAANKDEDEAKKLAQEFQMPNSSFSIYIPKISAKAPVIENVDSSNQKAYMNALKLGVAHAAGSVFPGMPGATFLFAHSSDAGWSQAKYNTVFYLLRELNAVKDKAKPLGGGILDDKSGKGDEIYLFFLDKLYKYEVTEKHIVDPGDISWLTYAKEGSERLILQTCWPPGTALKRLIIVAKPIE